MSESSKYFRISMNPLRIRQAASLNLNGCWMLYSIGIFIYYLFTEVTINIVNYFFPTGYINLSMAQLPADVQASMKEASVSMPQIPVLLILYMLLMSGAFELGRTFYTMIALRDRVLIPRVVFDGFGYYVKATLIFLVRYILIALGSMFFLIPGIYLFYSYRQAYYVFLESDQKLGVIGSLRESRRIMKGNKMSLFRLDISYIFLLLLSYMPSYLLVAYGVVNVNGLSGMLMFYLLQIPYFMAMGNYYMGQTVFYELIRFGDFGKFPYHGEEFFRKIAEK